MPSLLEKARKSQKKEEKFASGKGDDFRNPFGETWQEEYTRTDICMTCDRENIPISRHNGTCLVCDDVFTEEEYFIRKRYKTPETIDDDHNKDLFNDNIKKLVKKKPLTDDIFDSVEDNKLQKQVEKEEIIETESNKIEFSFSTYPIIAMLWGYDGTSKSEQLLKFEPKELTLVFDLEDKLRPLAHKLDFPQENIINAKKYNKKYDVSGPETLQGIRNILNEIKKCKQEKKGKFKDIIAIGFDGLSDIRKPYAVLEWLKEHPERKKPMNWGDWGEINDKVKDICFSLINMGLVTGTNIFFTAQIDYKDDKEVPDCKPWIWHNVHHKFKMTRDDENHKFFGYCEKSHHDPFWTVDLTDFTHKKTPSLLNILQDPKLVQKYREEFNEKQSELAEKKMNGDLFD